MELSRVLSRVVRGAVILIASMSAALGAQTGKTSTFVAGVADAETGQPLEGAEIILLGVHRLARANALGEATLDKIPQGAQRVRVRKIGYAPSEVDVAVAGDTAGAVFRLQRSVTKLGAVNVEAAWEPPQMKDVETRRKQGIGRFLSDVDLQKDQDRDMVLVLTTRFPGLRTVFDVNTGNRLLASTRDHLSISTGKEGVEPCFVTVYVDGNDVPSADMDLIRTWDLAAIEYYTPEQVPPRYRTRPYACGVVLLWSKWY